MEGPAYGRPCRPQRQEVTEKSRSPSTYCWAMLLAHVYERQAQRWACFARRGCKSSRSSAPLRRADEDHRFRDRGGFHSPYPRPPPRAHPTSVASPRPPAVLPGRRTSNPAKTLTSASPHPSDSCLDIRPSAIRPPKAPTTTRNPAGIGPKASYPPSRGPPDHRPARPTQQ